MTSELRLIALLKSELAEALRELGIASRSLPSRKGRGAILRLGLAQASAGNKQGAEENLRRAPALGPDPVRKLALDELNRLKR